MKFKEILKIGIFMVLMSVIQVWGNLLQSVFTKDSSGYASLMPLLWDYNSYERPLRFSVRTPRDARILVVTGYEDVYEIVLGARDNTINFIYDSKYPEDDDEPKAVVRTVNLLSQQEFRNFWIRLKDDSEENDSNILQVGIGDEDTPFLEWRDNRRFTPEYNSSRSAEDNKFAKWELKPRFGPQYVSFRSEAWAEWRWGYIDETYTEAIYSTSGLDTLLFPGGAMNSQFFPLSELASHSDDGLTLWMRIKSNDSVSIVLSSTVGLPNRYLTFIINKKVIYLQSRDGLGSSQRPIRIHGEDGLGTAENPDVEFWMKWTQDGRFMLGKVPSKRPIYHSLSLEYLTLFVSFGLLPYNSGDTSSMEFNSEHYGRNWLQDCPPRWKTASKQKLPIGAVAGGYNDEDQLLYVCRASHFGHMLPGSFRFENETKGTCHIAMGIEVVKKTTFQVLTGCKFGWAAASLGEIPEDAVPAGRTGSNEVIYAARVSYGGRSIIGKLQSNQRIAYVTFNDEVIPSTNYELLIKGLYDSAE